MPDGQVPPPLYNFASPSATQSQPFFPWPASRSPAQHRSHRAGSTSDRSCSRRRCRIALAFEKAATSECQWIATDVQELIGWLRRVGSAVVPAGRARTCDPALARRLCAGSTSGRPGNPRRCLVALALRELCGAADAIERRRSCHRRCHHVIRSGSTRLPATGTWRTRSPAAVGENGSEQRHLGSSLLQAARVAGVDRERRAARGWRRREMQRERRAPNGREESQGWGVNAVGGGARLRRGRAAAAHDQLNLRRRRCPGPRRLL